MQRVPFDLCNAIDHAQGVLNGVARRCAEEGYLLDVRTCTDTGQPRFSVAAVREIYAAGDPILEHHETQPQR